MIEFIEQKKINLKTLYEIVDIKSISWNYPKSSHLQWIEQHLKEDDIHVLYKQGVQCLAYLNLVKRELMINNHRLTIYGVGNVCSRKKDSGYGRKILEGVSKYFKEHDLVGVLFCKESLIPFYNKFNWVLIKKLQFHYALPDGIVMMIINFSEEISEVSYEGDLF